MSLKIFQIVPNTIPRLVQVSNNQLYDGNGNLIPNPVGPQGKQGLSFSWMGTYATSSTYSYYNVVEYDGSSYIYLGLPVSGVTPSTTTQSWALLASRGFQGFQGPQGVQGFRGFQGVQGFQGYTGVQGPTGIPVPFYYSNTSPTASSLTAGSRWFHSDTGVEYIYIDDGNSLQWVQPTSTVAGSLNYYTSQITSSSYSISVYSQYGPEYFGVSCSSTSYLYLPTNIVTGKTITIKDESGRASIYPINIIAFSGEYIDNSTDVQMAINYGSLTMLRRNNNWWII